MAHKRIHMEVYDSLDVPDARPLRQTGLTHKSHRPSGKMPIRDAVSFGGTVPGKRLQADSIGSHLNRSCCSTACRRAKAPGQSCTVTFDTFPAKSPLPLDTCHPQQMWWQRLGTASFPPQGVQTPVSLVNRRSPRAGPTHKGMTLPPR